MVAGQSMILISYPSLKQQLAELLFAAALSEDQSLSTLPLQTGSSPGAFVSPLALKIAAGKDSPLVVAEQILTAIPPQPQMLKLWAEPSGWIYGQFTGDAIATWLQQLIETRPHLQHSKVVPLDNSLSDPHLFPVQYAHARCCSLLRLAQQERIIELQRGYAISTPISWCTNQGQLYLQHPAEQTLLQNLLNFPGALQTSKRSWHTSDPGVPLPWPLDADQLRRQTQQWGEQFLQFYRDCRIFGRTHPAPLVQARLGLVSATQRVLAFLLQDLLHLVAPTEL